MEFNIGKCCLTLIIVFNSVNLIAQLDLSKAKRTDNIIYNIVDHYTGEVTSFKKVKVFYDGTEMNFSKCDNIIYVSYQKEFFKRVYSEDINVKWFGCNETRIDNQILINEVLRKYGTATIPSGTFIISGSIIIPENAQLKGYGKNSVLKLKSSTPIDGIKVLRGAVVKDFRFDCTETDLNLNAAILIIPWHSNSSIGVEIALENIIITGNYPQLQGVGVKLEISRNTDKYSLIAFSKFLNLNIYGFRDGIVCGLDSSGNNGISYINANTFNNITIYNCLRPIRLINSANRDAILEGKATIMSNSFSEITIQHVVGNYPAIYADGAVFNSFSTHIIDWPSLVFDQTVKSSSNVFFNFSSNK